MKTFITFITLLLLFSCVTSGQTIIIDESIKIDSTRIEFKSNHISYDYIAYSTIDNKKSDSLSVNVYSIGLGSLGLIIKFIDNIDLSLSYYSDVNEFDGKHTLDIELENYELTINKGKLELGDTLMGIVSGETKEFEFMGKTCKFYFEGYFHHIIGKVLTKRYEGGKYDTYDPRH